jgi:DNA-binding transcriptional ArsR family regulator
MRHKYEQNEHLLMLFRRTERLTTALYLVTNLFHDSEPLKWTLRERGVYLLSNVLPLRGKPLSTEVRERLRPAVSEIVGHLDIAKIAGIVSDMNSSVLKREYISLVEHLEELKDIPADKTALESKTSTEGEAILSDIIKDIYKRHSIGHTDKGHHLMSFTSKSRQDGSRAGTRKGELTQGKYGSPMRDGQEPLRRKNQVLKLFQEGQKHTIKDIASAIGGVSEKTVQRDLMTLVSQGTLKKEGERRWSRYSLAR